MDRIIGNTATKQQQLLHQTVDFESGGMRGFILHGGEHVPHFRHRRRGLAGVNLRDELREVVVPVEELLLQEDGSFSASGGCGRRTLGRMEQDKSISQRPVPCICPTATRAAPPRSGSSAASGTCSPGTCQSEAKAEEAKIQEDQRSSPRSRRRTGGGLTYVRQAGLHRLPQIRP